MIFRPIVRSRSRGNSHSSKDFATHIPRKFELDLIDSSAVGCVTPVLLPHILFSPERLFLSLFRSETSASLHRLPTQLIRKVVPDCGHANRPLSHVLAGQSVQRETVATTLQTPLQPRTTEPSTRRTNAS